MNADHVLSHPALRLLDDESKDDIRRIVKTIEEEAYTEGWVAAKANTTAQPPIPAKTITVWEDV